jgi:hypothetical protein
MSSMGFFRMIDLAIFSVLIWVSCSALLPINPRCDGAYPRQQYASSIALDKVNSPNQ